MRMSKNASSLKLCYMMSFILGYRLRSKFWKSLIQNMKQSSRYLFHDLKNTVFIFLYFFSMILYRFSSKTVKVKVTLMSF